jgi:hypothetical protein
VLGADRSGEGPYEEIKEFMPPMTVVTRPAQTKHLGQTEKKKMASLEDIVDTVDDVVSPSDFIAKTIEI